MASMHSCRDAVFAGFRNGFAGCPCLPYSRMLASLALLPPSERGSAKPTLMSWLPSRFSLEGERPSAPSSSPVVRDLNFVPLPITKERLLLTFFSTTSPPACRTVSATLSKLLPSLEIFRRNSSGIFMSHLANGRHLLFCQYFNVHPTAFDILYGHNVVAAVIADEKLVSRDRQPRNPPKAEQVSSFTECSEVCPTLAAVSTFPVYTDGSEDFILGMGEALAVLDLADFYDVGEAVYFSETHAHTFQSRSSRNSRLTVFHTCCAAPVLSAKKPPVLPSRLS
nr:MAG TPA: hypothetical protein [Caudoviricetes sp.]